MFYALESAPMAPMGRMFSAVEKQGGRDILMYWVGIATARLTRWILFVLELLCAITGYWFVTFRWGVNSQLCRPTVYWATDALTKTAAIVVIFGFLTIFYSFFIHAYLMSPWVLDFFGSFRAAKMEREEQDEEIADRRAAEFLEANKDAVPFLSCLCPVLSVCFVI